VSAARLQGVRDQRLLDAVATVPRAAFVPAESVDLAYRDKPVPISHRQVTTQPSLVAVMVDALGPSGHHKVLELGTGYGYQTALLAKLAREVWSVELWDDMVAASRRSLDSAGITNVHLVAGDGTLGLPEAAPFDRIVIAAAFPDVPQPLVEQLADGGRLVQPIGPGGSENVTQFEKTGCELAPRRYLIPAHFVPLYGEHGYPLSEAPVSP
jgi:protein-L-isoaspartate(D-aspartate) O-methyltransferase